MEHLIFQDESPDEAKMSSELANELLRKWWPARLEDPIDDWWVHFLLSLNCYSIIDWIMIFNQVDLLH